ncbi:MAG: triose-phosphate isomerase [Candidatus Roizmanbacteria bacterium]
MEKPIIIANWKMSKPKEGISSWFDAIEKDLLNKELALIICPPFPYLKDVQSEISRRNLSSICFLGAQDVSPFSDDPKHTGSVSAKDLKDFNVKYVIIGHSETRTDEKLTGDDVNAKIANALSSDILPVVCISNNKQLESLDSDYSGLIAYEPLEAIGSDHPQDPNTVSDFCKSVGEMFPQVTILYGGSVNGDNIQNYLNLDLISGVLIGNNSSNSNFLRSILSKYSK